MIFRQLEFYPFRLNRTSVCSFKIYFLGGLNFEDFWIRYKLNLLTRMTFCKNVIALLNCVDYKITMNEDKGQSKSKENVYKK